MPTNVVMPACPTLLIARGRVGRLPIVCPTILREQWREELRSNFDIRSQLCRGREIVISSRPGTSAGISFVAVPCIRSSPHHCTL